MVLRVRSRCRQLRLQHVARLRVERAERLVHEQDVGLERERARQRHALPHAAGQLVHPGAREAPTSRRARDILDARLALAARHAQLLHAEGDVVGDAQPGEERRVLEHDAAIGAGPAHALAADTHLALVGALEAGDEVEQRRLAAPRRADQADELAVVDGERHLAQRRGHAARGRFEALCDAADFDHTGGMSKAYAVSYGRYPRPRALARRAAGRPAPPSPGRVVTIATITAITRAMSPSSRPVARSCPRPPETKRSSPAISDRHAKVQPSRMPERIAGSAAGRITRRVQRRAARAHRPRRAHVERRHVRHARLGGDGDGEQRAGDDDEQDRGLAQPEPEQRQRQPADRRQRLQTGDDGADRLTQRRERASARPSATPPESDSE